MAKKRTCHCLRPTHHQAEAFGAEGPRQVLAGSTAELADHLRLPIIGPHPGDQFWIDGLPQQSAMFGFPPAGDLGMTRCSSPAMARRARLAKNGGPIPMRAGSETHLRCASRHRPAGPLQPNTPRAA